jgi:hypothetical protein
MQRKIRVSRHSLLFRMLLVVLALVTARGVAAEREKPPQVCLSQADGGLACRCTTTHTALVDSALDVDCSSRNLSTLPVKWQILQDARHLDLSRNQLSSLEKGKDGNIQFIALTNSSVLELSSKEHIMMCYKLN